jgi:hypothetical protein
MTAARGLRIAYADLPARARLDLCPRNGRLLVVLGPPGGPDLGTVGALARLVLQARRCDAGLRVVASGADLRRLVGLAGLCEVVGPHNATPPP